MRTFLLILITLVTLSTTAQNLSATNFEQLKKIEDTIKTYGRKMIMEKNASDRFVADSVFIRMLVRSLKTPNSFYYPYDSLETISRIYAPDSSFRIFSWQFSRDENQFRQRGAIQMRTSDGSLKLYPLLDMSDFTPAPQDSVRTAQNWIGAIYYGIVEKNYNNKNYYTLLGYDDNNMRSTKKWIEVLTFNDQGKPVFGGPYFTLVDNQKSAAASKPRFCLEYKKDGRARMNYDKQMDMIVYDHLVSESSEPDKAYTMVPDGDYQGFKWVNGKWSQIDKVFDYKLQDGQAPIPEPLKDATGKSNEEKLLLQSQKNQQKGKPVKRPVTNKKDLLENRQPKEQNEE